MAHGVDQLAAHFAAIASCIEECCPEATLQGLMDQAKAFCEMPGSPELKPLLSHLSTVLQTWQDVWPRLGGQREFRAAVAREARRWSQQLLSHELEQAP